MAKTIIATSKSNAVCAPGRKFVDGHCAPLSILVEMAIAYNKEFPNDKISLFPPLETMNPSKYKKYLVMTFEEKLRKSCDNHRCWTTQPFVHHLNHVSHRILTKHTHRPIGPQGRFDWLSNFDIMDVMEQYEHKFPKFKFFGAVPMDFADLDVEINKANYHELKKMGKTKLGLIFNLDTHEKSGSHWVAMFSNFDSGEIYYFDSFGVEPTPETRKLMRKQHREMIKMGLNDIIVDHNRQQHQKRNTECGVYSLNFIIRMAKGHQFDHICNNPINDRQINKCRKIYFDCNKKK